jgi:hypothetical protein
MEEIEYLEKATGWPAASHLQTLSYRVVLYKFDSFYLTPLKKILNITYELHVPLNKST